MQEFENGLVSIVIPVFNRKDLIEECLKSALNQTYLNFEIIVYDNRSSDGTWELLQNITRDEERIKIFQQDKNVGPVRNWHSAISKANGQFLKILFSDDLIYPQFLEKTVKKFSKDVGFVTTSFDMGPNLSQTAVMNDWIKVDGLIESSRYIDRALSRFAFLVSPGAALFRTVDVLDVFEEEIPSPRLTDFKAHGAGPDLLIFLKIARKYPYIYKINKSLTLFRNHSDSQTNKMNKSRDGLIQSSYMQTRVYFAETSAPRLWSKMLGKALFIELFQNKNSKVIPIKRLVSAYSTKKQYSSLMILLGFLSAFKNALYEVVRRYLSQRKLT